MFGPTFVGLYLRSKGDVYRELVASDMTWEKIIGTLPMLLAGKDKRLDRHGLLNP
jgi:hypothetical protein